MSYDGCRRFVVVGIQSRSVAGTVRATFGSIATHKTNFLYNVAVHTRVFIFHYGCAALKERSAAWNSNGWTGKTRAQDDDTRRNDDRIRLLLPNDGRKYENSAKNSRYCNREHSNAEWIATVSKIPFSEARYTYCGNSIDSFSRAILPSICYASRPSFRCTLATFIHYWC